MVYNTIGFGFLESVYENALSIELNKTGLKVEKLKQITVLSEGEAVGNFRADIRINDLVTTTKPVDQLLNLRPNEVEVKRKV